MTSPATHEATITFLEENKNFGLPSEDLFLFCQGSMPAVDAKTGRLLLATQSEIFLSPDGHGGTIAALQKSGAIDVAHQRGLKQLFYFQVDNPLAPVCDPAFLGYHLSSGSELSSLAITKEKPEDKVGNFVAIDGKTHVIEYIDFPQEAAESRDSEGNLAFWAGSVAIHIFDVAFLDRVLELANALPFHIALKKVPYMSSDGVLVEPETPNALKFERFIFDLLPEAKNAIVVEADETKIFAPLKNASGAERDTPEFVHDRMLSLFHTWLRSAGATVESDARVELCPLYALDAHDLQRHDVSGKHFRGEQYLRSSD